MFVAVTQWYILSQNYASGSNHFVLIPGAFIGFQTVSTKCITFALSAKKSRQIFFIDDFQNTTQLVGSRKYLYFAPCFLIYESFNYSPNVGEELRRVHYQILAKLLGVVIRCQLRRPLKQLPSILIESAPVCSSTVLQNCDFLNPPSSE